MFFLLLVQKFLSCCRYPGPNFFGLQHIVYYVLLHKPRSPTPDPIYPEPESRTRSKKKCLPKEAFYWSNQFLFFTLNYFVYFMIGIVYCPIPFGYQISFINNLKIFSNSPKFFYNLLFSHYRPHRQLNLHR